MTEQHPFAPAKAHARFDRASPAAGMALLVVAMSMIPVMDGIAKHLTQSLPPMQVVWARYFFHVALFLPFVVWRYGRGTFRPRHVGLQLFRGVALLVSTCCFFFAVKHLPLADTLAVVFVYPFVVTALAPIVLGDAVGFMRWAAVSVGFVGAMVIIRPGFVDVSPSTLLALGAGLSYAVYVLGTRRLRGGDPALVTLVWTGIIGTLASTAVLPLVWVMPNLQQAVLMVLIGGMAAVGHYMIILAYERATAPQLAPFGYVEIVAATAVGYIAFGDFPDYMTWIGMALIVASGLFIAWREAVRGVVR